MSYIYFLSHKSLNTNRTRLTKKSNCYNRKRHNILELCLLNPWLHLRFHGTTVQSVSSGINMASTHRLREVSSPNLSHPDVLLLSECWSLNNLHHIFSHRNGTINWIFQPRVIESEKLCLCLEKKKWALGKVVFTCTGSKNLLFVLYVFFILSPKMKEHYIIKNT